MILTVTAVSAEGEVILGQVDYAAHGTGCFGVITVALHIEVAPVTLLAADALTGATVISFFAPAAE